MAKVKLDQKTIVERKFARRAVRYWLFRFQKEAEDGTLAIPTEGAIGPCASVDPADIKRRVESMPDFERLYGWRGFGRTWDTVQIDAVEWVPETGPYVIVERLFTIEEEWHATLRRVVPELPIRPMPFARSRVAESEPDSVSPRG